MNKAMAMVAVMMLTACAADSSTLIPTVDSATIAAVAGAPDVFPTLADLSHGPYVFGDDGMLAPGHAEVFADAVARINEEVGFEALRYEPGNPHAQGMYVNEVPEAPTRIAHAFRERSTGECHILMGRPAFFGVVGSPSQTVDITTAMHESLHCLGIDHDHGNSESLMSSEHRRDIEQYMTPATIQLIRAMKGL